METPPVHIIELKRQLADAIGSIDKLTNLSNDQLMAEQERTELTLVNIHNLPYFFSHLH